MDHKITDLSFQRLSLAQTKDKWDLKKDKRDLKAEHKKIADMFHKQRLQAKKGLMTSRGVAERILHLISLERGYVGRQVAGKHEINIIPSLPLLKGITMTNSEIRLHKCGRSSRRVTTSYQGQENKRKAEKQDPPTQTKPKGLCSR